MIKQVKYITVLLILCFIGCSNNSDSQEDSERLARRERELQKTLEDQKTSKQEETPSESQVEERSEPAGPQYREVTYYYFTSNSERNPIKCRYKAGSESDEAETQSACGERFYECTNGATYTCQTGVRYTTKEEKELIQEDNN